MSQTLIASVTSDATPQSGQSQRSSGDFSTENAPSGTNWLWWQVVPGSGVPASSITFDVMKDVSVGHDPTEYSGVKNNQQTSYTSSRTLYIANPKGAEGETFTVQVYAVTS